MSDMSQVTPDNIPAMENSSCQTVIGRVAAILLGNAGDETTRKSALSQREMASLSETTWEQVNKSLIYLHKKGAIRIDRHRIIVREPSLRKIAGGFFS
jgi:hypothetical protein